MRRILGLVLVLIAGGGYPAMGQWEDGRVREVKLTLSPAGEAQPALKYGLIPPLIDQTAGDGMATYMSALGALEEGAKDGEISDKIQEWYDAPAEKVDWAGVQSLVERFSSQIGLLDKAARYKSSQWNLPFDTEGISMQLPSLSRLRFGAKIVILRTRLAIHQGRFDDAVRSMQTSFAMARQTSDGPTFIQSLVGTAIAALGLQAGVEDFIAAPNSPNLYWALSSLPQPLILTGNALQGESYMILGTFHELKDGMNAKLNPQEWDALLRKVVKTIADAQGDKSALTLQIMQAYPKAKQYWRSQGMSAEQVDAMPVGKAVLLYSLGEFEVIRDNTFKWWNVPFWQAWPHLARVESQIQQASEEGRGAPFLSMMASLGRARSQYGAMDKRLAVLRVIEAIRIYAAGHEGRLPSSLADIEDVPVPLNPMTGEAFPYRLDGDSAVLEAPSPKGVSSVFDQRYILTIRK